MRQAVLLIPTLVTIIFMSDVHTTLAADHAIQTPTSPESRVERAGQWKQSALDVSTRHSGDGLAPGFTVLDNPTDTSSGGAGSLLALEDEPPVGENVIDVPSDLKHDWPGLRRDTMFFLGYQAVAAGILYVLPESVTKWTVEQRKTSLQRWWENVRDPHWDKDVWYVNYLGHPYFGAIAYTRARERGFGPFGGFWYAAVISGLYEFGIEALFERPSYQDLIVTPVGGLFLGALLFDPIRNYINGKPEMYWYDYVSLALIDPLGTGNRIFERLLGLETDIRLQFHLPALAPYAPFDEPSARDLNRSQALSHQSPAIGIELVFQGKKLAVRGLQ
jgi:Domain of unknown function (DUF3943)